MTDKVTDNTRNHGTMIQAHAEPKALKRFPVYSVEGLHQSDCEIHQHNDVVFLRSLRILNDIRDIAIKTFIVLQSLQKS